MVEEIVAERSNRSLNTEQLETQGEVRADVDQGTPCGCTDELTVSGMCPNNCENILTTPLHIRSKCRIPGWMLTMLAPIQR